MLEGSSKDYDLENAIFMHYTGAKYDGWYLRDYSYPAYYIYNVYGDKSAGQIYHYYYAYGYGPYYIYYYY